MTQLSSGGAQPLLRAINDLQLSATRLQHLALQLRQQPSSDPVQQTQSDAIQELVQNAATMRQILGTLVTVVLAAQPSREAAVRVRDGTSNTIGL